jgi:NTP pyrophosphatase (non-canonical NTP hydrolase)
MSITANEYQQGAATTAIYPGRGTTMGLVYTVLGLAGESGEIANKVKKVLRDNDGVLSPEVRAKLIDEASDVAWYLSQVCDELSVDLDTVFEINLAKLAGRAERGTLQGEGDVR